MVLVLILVVLGAAHAQEETGISCGHAWTVARSADLRRDLREVAASLGEPVVVATERVEGASALLSVREASGVPRTRWVQAPAGLESGPDAAPFLAEAGAERVVLLAGEGFPFTLSVVCAQAPPPTRPAPEVVVVPEPPAEWQLARTPEAWRLRRTRGITLQRAGGILLGSYGAVTLVLGAVFASDWVGLWGGEGIDLDSLALGSAAAALFLSPLGVTGAVQLGVGTYNRRRSTLALTALGHPVQVTLVPVLGREPGLVLALAW